MSSKNRRMGTSTSEESGLLRLIFEKVSSLFSSIGAVSDGDIVVGTGIYQKDVTDSSVFQGSIRLRKIEEVSDTETYLGYSAITTSSSDTEWILVHINTSGSDTVFEYAIFDWDHRTTASYS